MTTTAHPALPAYHHRRGSGPTLVFLHYWGGSSRTWDPVLDRLSDRDVLTVDARGWAGSRELPGPYDLDQLALDTRAVLDDAGVADHVLVGHSMGGKVAQLVAATHPAGLRGLVLVATAPARPPATVTAAHRAALAHAYDSEESVAAALDQVLTATPLPQALRAQVLADSLAAADGARTEWPLRGIAADVTARTAAVDVPAVVVAGERDRVEPVEVLRAGLLPYLRDAELVVLPRVGHLLPLEAPEALAAVIADASSRFTAGALPARPAAR